MNYLLAVCPVCAMEWNYGYKAKYDLDLEWKELAAVHYQTACPRCGCQSAIIPAWDRDGLWIEIMTLLSRGPEPGVRITIVEIPT